MKLFSDLIYKRFDMAAAKKQLLAFIKEFSFAKTFEQADESLLKSEEMLRHLSTAAVLASVRYDMNTADKFYEEEVRYYNREGAKLMPLSLKSNKAILNSPFKKNLEEKYGSIYIKNIQEQSKLLSIFNIPDQIKESDLVMRYSKVAASAKVEFNGKECNFYGLLKFMESSDREVRKGAFEAWAALYQKVSVEIEDIYDKLVKIRVRMAKRLKFKNYTDYKYLDRQRYDYKQEDVASFRRQIKEIVTPLCQELAQKQAIRLNVDKLKFYDEKLIFAQGNADPVGTTQELITKTQQLYHKLSKETGEFFDFMVTHQLFDLETRNNKRLGGYCTTLDDYKAPFIFSNFNGTLADVGVLTHEAGHCFNAYLASRALPLSAQCFSTSEINEIHSMSMELFTFPYWGQAFFGGDENITDMARYAHIIESLFVLPYMCVVDEFQHEVYKNPSLTIMQRREVWRKIEKEYMPWRDYDGNEFLEGGGFWMQKQHIFMYPFYYIDYALAQLGAFEFYGKNVQNPQEAWQDYVNLCRAGGSKGYFELLKYAKLSNPFEEGTVKKAINYLNEFLQKDY